MIAKPDPHAGEYGKYLIHSLYFDSLSDKALREKLDGLENREKFRIRYYDDNIDYIRLEKKSKIHGLCDKQSTPLSKNETMQICSGNIGFMAKSDRPLLKELYAKMRYQLLKPKTIVDYEREPYVYAPGNVRITFDSNIRTGLYHNRLFEKPFVSIPAENGCIILEVKYDSFLPEIIEKAVRIPNRNASAFSKYAVCRIYG